MRRASLTAGIGTLLMIPPAVFGNFVAVQGLLTRGDAETTARDILASENTFRLGIVSLFLVIVLDVVVAGALFRVFSPVSRAISKGFKASPLTADTLPLVPTPRSSGEPLATPPAPAIPVG